MAEETRIIRIVIDSSKAVDGSAAATRALANIDKSTKDAADAMNRMEAALGRVGGWLKVHIAQVAAEYAAKLFEMARSAFAAASGLEELAQQMGITARGLQGLQYAAVQNGVSLEQLETGISKFSQKIGEAADGSKEMIESLDKIGVKILDANGKLLPTETLLQRVAKAITEIEDPAKKSAAAVDFFGRAGVKLLASLEDFSRGTAALSAKAEQSGALISDQAIKTLDKFADDIEKRKLRSRAVFAELIADLLDGLEKLRQKMQVGTDEEVRRRSEQEAKAVKESFQNAFDWLSDGLADLVAVGARFGAEFIESLATLPGALKNLFVRGMDGALDALETGLNKMKSGLADSWLGRQIGIDGSPVNLGRIGGTVSNDDYTTGRNAQIAAAGQNAYNSVRQMYPAGSAAAARSQQRYQSYMNGAPGDMIAGIDSLAAGGGDGAAPGAKNPPPKGGGGGGKESPEEKLAKLETQLRNTAEAQNAMTAAARQGDVAFEEQKASLDATQKLLDIFGVTLDKTDERFMRVRDRLLEIARGKAAESFNTATTELQKQNVVLEAQIRLMGEAPEIQAREIALIKSKQEAEKAGKALTDEDIEKRRQAIEINERLKVQQDELKKSQELWTEPLKTALQDIQRIGADSFDKILESGKLSFEDLQQTVSRILRRIAAEFLELATIRPVMSVLVNAVSPGFAQSMGLGNTGLGGIGGSSGGSLFGGGGLSGGGGGSLFGFLNNPITPTSYLSGYGEAADIASLTGTAMPGGLTSGGMLGGLTWGGGIAGALGIGAGIYGLATAKTPSGAIGSGLGIVGSGVGLASAMGLLPMLGAAGGPIGMGIGVLGAILASTGLLDGLFGGGYQLPPLVGGNTGWGWDTTSGGYGIWNNTQHGGKAPGTYGDLPSAQAALYALAGGVTDNSKIWGNAVWQNDREGQTTAFLMRPGVDGGAQQWWQGSGDSTPWVQQAAAKSALLSLTGGGVNISSTLAKVLGKTFAQDGSAGGEPASVQQLAQIVQSVVDFEKALANLGKTSTQAEQALQTINDQLGQMWGFAKANDLDTTKIEAFKEKTLVDTAKSFMAQFDNRDQKTIALEALDKQYEQIRKEATAWQGILNTRPDLYGVDGVEAYYIDMTKIEEKYLKDRAALMEQYSNQSLGSLMDVIKRLTYGDLSGASPGDVLSGTRGTYMATLAKARAGDSAAIAALGGAIGDYAQAAGGYYDTAGSSYQAIRTELQANAMLVAGNNGADLSALGPAIAALIAQVADLNAQIASYSNDNQETQRRFAELNDLMTRIAVAGVK